MAGGKDARCKPRSTLTAALVTATLGLWAVPCAQASPRILSVDFDRGAVTGQDLELRVRASDPAAPVGGLIAGFGSGQGGFGLSSCAIDSSAGVLSPKGPVGLAAPHAFSSSGPRSMAAAVTSGGCAPGAGSTLQRLTAEVVPPGAAPKPISLLPPVALEPNAPLPELPGLGRLPLPGILPPLPVPGRSSAVVMASLRCPGASNRVRSTKQGRKRARRSLLCLLNYERTRRGLRPVRSDRRLTRAAFGHSRRMVRLRFFAHVGPGSLSLSGRLRRARYLPARGGGWFVGENIAFGRGRSGSPLGVHRAWMHSTPHRLDMLHPRFRQVGFGIYRGAPYGRRGVTYTADFGRKGR